MRRLTRYAEEALVKGARAVILIGSLARGDYTAFSDADLLIIVEESAERPLDRVAKFIDPSMPIDLEPRVYTIDELAQMAKRGARMVKEALSHGKLLAGDERLIAKLKESLENMVEKR